VSDEAILVVAILSGIAVMIVLLVRYQRGKETRLAALTEIEIPIDSVARSVLIVLPAVCIGPVLVAVFGAMTDPWLRSHALAGTVTSIGLGVAGLFGGLRVSRRFRRVGLLRYTPARLELQVGKEIRHIDLDQPYMLDEGMAWGPGNMPLQVLYVRQGRNVLKLSYGLPLGRKAHGERQFETYVIPLVDGEARVVHDRLRARLGRGAGATA
jgi:hypothetical protein